MNIMINLLRVLRKIYSKIYPNNNFVLKEQEVDPDIVSNLIYSKLISPEPCMIGRFGDGELALTANYYGISQSKRSVIKYIKGEKTGWWWNKGVLSKFETEFVHYDVNNFINFGKMMLNDATQVDILAEWFTEFKNLYYIKNLISQAHRVTLLSIEPYWAKQPWTKALHGKKVLVINMFADLIEQQYKENRTKLFEIPNVLPEFELHIIKAINIYDREPERFNGWFEELEWMKSEMDKIDYDIALIGCGAYGFPLAAHAKRMGKKSVHLGGALQLLFGIKGKRWENPDYGAVSLKRKNAYPELFNEYWICPDELHTPKGAKSIEGGCYW